VIIQIIAEFEMSKTTVVSTVISTALISPSKILARFQGIKLVWLKIQVCRDVYAVSTGKGSPTLRRNVVPSSSTRRQLLDSHSSWFTPESHGLMSFKKL